MISFKDTHNDAEVYDENNRYIHFHTPSQLIKYYANYFEYKVMPSLADFEKDLHEPEAFHLKHNQHHGLFIFPEIYEIPEDILNFAFEKGYKLEKMELYELCDSPHTKEGNQIECKDVGDDQTFKDFLETCRIGELEFGEAFADLKAQVHERDRYDPSILQIVGYLDGPAGKIEAIISDRFIEIDDFYVLEDKRSKGVGSALQRAVFEYAEDKQVILIADGNDTARDMYVKQGYVKVSERYELLKEPQS